MKYNEQKQRPPLPMLRHWQLVDRLVKRKGAPRLMRDAYEAALQGFTMNELRIELALVERESRFSSLGICPPAPQCQG